MNQRSGVGAGQGRGSGRGQPSFDRGRRARLLAAGAAGFCLAAAACLPAQAYEQRPNTFSLGLQGGAGIFSGQGEYLVRSVIGDTEYVTAYPYAKYDWGPGLGIRLRYSLDPTHAFGVSMEDVRFQRSAGQPAEADLGQRTEVYGKQLQLNNYLLDYYLYLSPGDLSFLGNVGRRYKNCPYLVIGLGMHRDSFRRSGEYDVALPPVGFVADLGFGWERFLHRSLSIDLSARGYYLKFSGGSGVAGTVQLGFQYYLLR